MSQLNGSAVHSHVSYPGNLTHRGNHDDGMTINCTVYITIVKTVLNKHFDSFFFVFRHVLLCLRSDSVLPAELPTVPSNTHTVPDKKTFGNGEREH